MKFKISITNEHGIELYQVRNEASERIYAIKKKSKLFGKKYELLDGRKNYIATVETTVGTKTHKFIENKKTIDELQPVLKPGVRQYQLLDNKWTIDIDKTFTEYIIYNEKNENMANVKFAVSETSWLVDVRNTKNINLLMLLLVSIISICKK